jgi:hypothetical protein
MTKPKRTRYEYPVHPLAAVFPELPPKEFKKLKDDIWNNGQREQIVLTADGKMLLDGRNRLRACKELGIEPWIWRIRPERRKEGSEEDYISSWIWSANMLRRHLTGDQRAAIAHKWSDAERKAAKERQKIHGGTAPGKSKDTSGESAPSVRTRAALAEKAKVSEHKIRQTDAVAKKAPHLLPKIASGELKLKDAVKTIRVDRPPSPGDPWSCFKKAPQEDLTHLSPEDRARVEAFNKENGVELFRCEYPDGDHAKEAVVKFVMPLLMGLEKIVGPLFDSSGNEIRLEYKHPCYGVMVRRREAAAHAS